MEKHLISEFTVIGISARISNQNGSAAKEVEDLWTRFWNGEIMKQIPESMSNDIYAVYTDYETDHTGPFSLIIGLPVKHTDNVPKGLVAITIQEDSYEKYISKGKMPEAVLNTWMEIWGDNKLKRAFNTDFTIHGKKYYDGDNAEVETFISIKE